MKKNLEILKIFIFTIVIVVTSSSYVICQDTTDVFRLRNLEYMNNTEFVDCENLTGTSLEKRICLNKQFQKVDSLLNYNFSILLNNSNSEREKQILKKNHSEWIIQRRKNSEFESDGFRGHTFGIIYLQTMIEITNIKLEEIKNQIKTK